MWKALEAIEINRIFIPVANSQAAGAEGKSSHLPNSFGSWSRPAVQSGLVLGRHRARVWARTLSTWPRMHL